MKMTPQDRFDRVMGLAETIQLAAENERGVHRYEFEIMREELTDREKLILYEVLVDYVEVKESSL